MDERLQAFTDDLDRAERHLEAQLARLEQRHRQAIVEVEHRIEAEAAELGSTRDEQRKTVMRLREELERAATEAVTEALDELEARRPSGAARSTRSPSACGRARPRSQRASSGPRRTRAARLE